MRNWKYVLTFIVCLLVLAGGWFVVPNPGKPVLAQNAAQVQPSGSGILDGKMFSGRIFVKGEPLELIDKWVFARGTFESTECSARCNYPRAPYFVRRLSEAIEFISESHCLDKDAKIVWRGTIEHGKIKGYMVWTINRWYWTIEKKFKFEGSLIERTTSVGSN